MEHSEVIEREGFESLEYGTEIGDDTDRNQGIVQKTRVVQKTTIQ